MLSRIRSFFSPGYEQKSDNASFEPARRAGMKIILTAMAAGLFGAAATKEVSAQRSRGERGWWQRGRSRTR